MVKYFLALAWAILLVLTLDAATALISSTVTLGVIAGIFLVALFIAISIKTKCLTKNPFKK